MHISCKELTCGFCEHAATLGKLIAVKIRMQHIMTPTVNSLYILPHSKPLRQDGFPSLNIIIIEYCNGFLTWLSQKAWTIQMEVNNRLLRYLKKNENWYRKKNTDNTDISVFFRDCILLNFMTPNNRDVTKEMSALGIENAYICIDYPHSASGWIVSYIFGWEICFKTCYSTANSKQRLSYLTR
jgi:hypothetical protein